MLIKVSIHSHQDHPATCFNPARSPVSFDTDFALATACRVVAVIKSQMPKHSQSSPDLLTEYSADLFSSCNTESSSWHVQMIEMSTGILSHCLRRRAMMAGNNLISDLLEVRQWLSYLFITLICSKHTYTFARSVYLKPQ